MITSRESGGRHGTVERAGFLAHAHPLAAPARFALFAAIFALAYTQSPLYSHAQNQYFLHGLAQTGVGLLQHDWAAGTADPTPMFTFLVKVTHRYVGDQAFYLYYGVLFGLYLYGLVGIAASVFDVHSARARVLAYLAVLVGLHSAVAAHLSSLILSRIGLPSGHHLRWFLFDGVAAQSVLETVFQPSVFGALSVLAVYLFLRGRRHLAAGLVAFAAAVHPGYLLTAALLAASFAAATFVETRSLKQALALGLTAGVVMLPPAVYALVTFAPTTLQAWTRAHEILAHTRIPWHALPREWWGAGALGKLILVIVALRLVRGTTLFAVLTPAVILSAALTAAQILTANATLALLFPWRISAVLVPIAASIVLAKIVAAACDALRWTAAADRRLQAASIAVLALVALGGAAIMKARFDGRAEAQDARMSEFVRTSVTSGQTFLIPPHMKDFRLRAGVPIFVDFEVVPYKDVEVLEWFDRLTVAQEIYGSGGDINCTVLHDRSDRIRATHVIVPTGRLPSTCAFLRLIYADPFYSIYGIPPSGRASLYHGLRIR